MVVVRISGTTSLYPLMLTAMFYMLVEVHVHLDQASGCSDQLSALPASGNCCVPARSENDQVLKRQQVARSKN